MARPPLLGKEGNAPAPNWWQTLRGTFYNTIGCKGQSISATGIFVRTTMIHSRCCIAGGGPAGMMLGFLLARAGIDVTVLEKHADFLRDFRGDTIHPSTLELMVELGLIDEFLKLPHSRVERLSGQVAASTIHLADFSHLPTHCKFIALMPQGDFLDFLAAHGKKYPTFDL